MTPPARTILLACAMLCGCAEGSDPQAAIKADPAMALSQPGDPALGCPAIEAGIAGMNSRITLAQRMTDQEVNGRTRLSAPTNDTRVTDTTVNGRNGPAGVGNGTTAYTDGRGAESNEVLVAQKGTAEAATARANELIRLGRAKRCFA
ncbi:MAG: hypothetical protein ACRYG6_12675 [Janthinobacterium lividum]